MEFTTVQCPGCGASSQVPASGPRIAVKCPACGLAGEMTLDLPEGVAPVATAAPPVPTSLAPQGHAGTGASPPVFTAKPQPGVPTFTADTPAAPGTAAALGAPAPTGAAAPSHDPRFQRPQIDVKQRIRSALRIGQQYDLTDPSDPKTVIGHAHRGFNFPFVRCDLVVYSDATRREELLRARQVNRVDMWSTFQIVDSRTGEIIAIFRRKFWHSTFLQRTWLVSRPDGTPWFMIQEDSLLKGLIRRIGGDFIPGLCVMLRTNMNFRSLDGRVDFGAFNRKFSLRDRYSVISHTPELDGRLVWIAGPLLDNAGGR